MTNRGSDQPRLSVVKEPPPRELLRILLVDTDEGDSLQLRRAFKSSRSARLDFARDVESATQQMAAQRFDLVVVDPALPGGFALLRQIKDNHRWIATLVVTANQSPSFMRQAVKCRIDGLLFKPVEPAEFMEQALLLSKAVSTRRVRQQKRVLAIGAHPDDVEIGCGGSLAKHHAKGDILHVLTLSRGAAGGDVNLRAAEAQRAAQLLGATLKLGDLRDTCITEGAETIGLIQAAVHELRPTHVYTHCSEDTHQDHRAAHASSLVAARGVPNVYCYQTPSSTVEFRPNRFVDITDFIKQKLQAIDSYKSQIDRMDALQHDVILSTARYWGRYAGYVLAEPMRIVRQRDGDMTPDIGKEYSPANAAPAVAG
jgi:LmbE family N-acetylglucosaminyl deacetylase